MSGTLDEPGAAGAPQEPPIPDASWAWAMLDLAPTEDETEIRRAYARRLKRIDPDSDAPAFIRLREARNLALYVAFRKAAADAAAQAPDPLAAPEPELADAPPPTAAPPPSEAEPGEAPAPPELDPALFQRIEQLLSGDAPCDHDALRDATAALLADPALDRIMIADAVENWTLQTILNTSPRSDPMLEPAIERFGWAKKVADWHQPRALEWILQRRYDAEFERDLVASDPKYAEVLAVLRTPGGGPPVKPAWALADGVRALLFHAREAHPTTINLCDRDVAEAWYGYVSSPPFPYGTFGPLARAWRGRGDPERIFGEERHVTPGLLIGTLVLPWLFAWGLMRPGLATGTRIFAAAWLTLLTAAIVLMPSVPRLPRFDPQMMGRPPAETSADSGLTTPEADIDPVLDRFTGGQLHLSGLQEANPRLYNRLMQAWQEARQHGASGRDFYEQVLTVLRIFYREAIRAGSPGIQAAYWRLKVDQLRWISQYGAEYCRQYLQDPDYPYRYPDDVLARAATLRNQVWSSVNADPPPRRTSVMVPGDIVAAAARRAHLGLAAFRTAMQHHGPEENVCAAEIALAETALAQPPGDSVRLLRELTLVE